MQSPRFSFNGWEMYVWLKGHWKTVKEAAKVLLPLWYSATQGWDPAVTLAATSIFVGFISGMEYFFKEYK